MLILAHILRSFFAGTRASSPTSNRRKETLAAAPLWTTVLVLLPIALAGLAALGHFLTAVALAY